MRDHPNSEGMADALMQPDHGPKYQHKSDQNDRKTTFRKSTVRVQTSTQDRCWCRLWSKLLLECCAGLICTYLLDLIAAKDPAIKLLLYPPSLCVLNGNISLSIYADKQSHYHFFQLQLSHSLSISMKDNGPKLQV